MITKRMKKIVTERIMQYLPRHLAEMLTDEISSIVVLNPNKRELWQSIYGEGFQDGYEMAGKVLHE